MILKPKAIGNFTSPFGASSFDLHFCCCSCASCCCSQAPIQTLQIKTPFFSLSPFSLSLLFSFLSPRLKERLQFSNHRNFSVFETRGKLWIFSHAQKTSKPKSMGSELDYKPNILDLTHKLNSLCLSQAVLENNST